MYTKRVIRWFGFFLAGLVCHASAVDPADFSGSWSGEWNSFDGYSSSWVQATLVQNGTLISGTLDVSTMYGVCNDLQVHGKVTGDKMSFKTSFQENGATYTLDYVNAKLVSPADSAHGDVYAAEGTYSVKENGRLWDRGTFYVNDMDEREDRLPRPDFVVQSINLIPETLVAGRKFSAEISVVNIGAASGSPGTVKVYHQGDEANALDLRVPTLRAGQQRVLKVMNKLIAKRGATALVAVIDPEEMAFEENETNNELQAAYTGGEPQVDVSVTGIELSDVSVPENGTFDAVVTVENTGSEACDAGELQVYLDGTPLGRTMRVSRMNPGQVKTVRMMRLTAAGLAGPHAVSATVDCFQTLEEIDEVNNTAQTAITLIEAPKPDFVVQSIDLIPETLVTGRKFSAEITVANIGDASGSPGVVRVYHQGDQANALELRLPSLKDGQQRVLKMMNKLIAKRGATALVAVIDPDNQAGEWDETNNILAVPYTGGEPQVDVAVTGIELSDVSVPENGTFDAVVTVENTGSEACDAGELQVYLDSTPLGRTMRVSRMNPGQVKTVRMMRLTAAGLAGPHAVSATVDCFQTLEEIDEVNNTAQTAITLTEAPKPDFVVQSIDLIPETLVTGRKFSAEITVANIGDASGSPGVVRVYHQGDQANALELRLPNLKDGQQRVLKVMNKLTAVRGETALVAVIDPDNQAGEWDETNNILAVPYTGGEPQVDVAVTGIELSDVSVPENGTFDAVVTVENTGSEACDAGELQVYLDGTPLGRTMRVSRMNPGQVKTVRMMRLTAAGLAGPHAVSATVDCFQTLEEIDEVNNTAQVAITLTEAPKPDLVISDIELSPAYPMPGESFTAYIYIENIGEADSKGGYLDIWMDGDTNAAPVQSIRLPAVRSGAGPVRKPVSRLISPDTAAEQMLVAVVDPDEEILEENESNNDFEKAYPNPLALYYPLNDGDWKTYTHNARTDITRNEDLSRPGSPVFNETSICEGEVSIGYMGYRSGSLVAYGVEAEGEVYMFGTPLLIVTAEQLAEGGTVSGKSRITVEGFTVNLQIESTVDITPTVQTGMGTFTDCRTLSYAAKAIVMGVDVGFFMKNASSYAAGVGPITESVYEIDDNLQPQFLFEQEITGGEINGAPVSTDPFAGEGGDMNDNDVPATPI